MERSLETLRRDWSESFSWHQNTSPRTPLFDPAPFVIERLLFTRAGFVAFVGESVQKPGMFFREHSCWNRKANFVKSVCPLLCIFFQGTATSTMPSRRLHNNRKLEASEPCSKSKHLRKRAANHSFYFPVWPHATREPQWSTSRSTRNSSGTSRLRHRATWSSNGSNSHRTTHPPEPTIGGAWRTATSDFLEPPPLLWFLPSGPSYCSHLIA